MAKQEFIGLRVSPEERQDLQEAANALGVSMSEAARLAIEAMAERLTVRTGAGRVSLTELFEGMQNRIGDIQFITTQAEWQDFIPEIVSGKKTYEEALTECAQRIALRLKSEAEAAERKHKEATKWPALFGVAED